jgi:hypothetical protein
LNPLQQLIVDRMAEKGWSFSDIERRSRDPATGKARISRSRVHQLATVDRLHRVPKFEAIEGLAVGLDLPLRVVWDAAAAAVGGAGLQHLYRQRSPDAEVLIASYEELSPEQRQMVAAIVETLRRGKG